MSPTTCSSAMETGTQLSRLGAAAGWDPDGPWCGFDRVVAGLTLYERPEAPCDSWRPMAAPGERTEFQGVPMTPWNRRKGSTPAF